jgi:hypothetical protein
MQKLHWFTLVIFIIFFNACHSGETSQPVTVTTPVNNDNIFPVTSFLRAQLKGLDTMPVTPLKIDIGNGKADSTWLKREDIRKEAIPFLSPEIDSLHMHLLYTEKSFLDQTINAYTFSYDPKEKLPDSIHLVHWDVYMNPQTNSIQRIYLVKQRDSAGTGIINQLTWVVDKWFSIRTITQVQGDKPDIKEKKMIWNFDE